MAELVDGLTKLEKLEFHSREHNQAESFRKMLLAMARDVRVILIKLADRTHNMRTMGDMPRSKVGPDLVRDARDLRADRAPAGPELLLPRAAGPLSFKHLFPWRYAILSKALTKSRSRRKDLIARVQAEVENTFGQHGNGARIRGREKTLFSIYRKMRLKHLSFAQVTDLYGFRIILPELMSATAPWGAAPALQAAAGQVPRPHRDPEGQRLPIAAHDAGRAVRHQHRVPAAHADDGRGRRIGRGGALALQGQRADSPAARTSARSGCSRCSTSSNRTHDAVSSGTMSRSTCSRRRSTSSRQRAASWRCRGAIDRDRLRLCDPHRRRLARDRRHRQPEQSPLHTELKNGDVVEITTSPHARPNPVWLGFVRTGRARSKIRHHLKTLELRESREARRAAAAAVARAPKASPRCPKPTARRKGLWDKLLRFTGNKTRDECWPTSAWASASRPWSRSSAAALLSEAGQKPDLLLMTQERYAGGHDKLSQGVLALDGSEGASVRYADCCHPIPGDAIVGYLGRGEGLVVHTDDCPVIQKQLLRDSERFTAVEWSDEPVRTFETCLIVTLNNVKGALAKVAAALAAAEADITHPADEKRNRCRPPSTSASRSRCATACTLTCMCCAALKRTPTVMRVLREDPGRAATHSQ